MLHLRTLGGLSLASDDRVLTGAAGQRRPLALLAVLAIAGEHGVARERLQALLWPESDAERGRKALAQMIYAVRRDLGDPAVVLGTADLRLNPGLVTPDVVPFEQAMDAGQPERAIVHYAGPFLDGVHLSDAAEFERWADAERHRLARRALGAIEQLACAAEQRGEWEVAIGWRHRLAALDPLNGRAAARLMQALAAAGDVAGALRHARVHETLLREELGAPPDADVTALSERLRTPTQAACAIPGAVAPPTASHAVAARSPSATAPDPLPAAPERASAEAVMASPPSELGGSSGRRGPATRGVRRWPLPALGIVVLVALGAAATRVLLVGSAAADRAVIAVVPFDAADPALRLWREGLVDVLSRNLDGAGPLRAVSPTTVVRRWSGRADRTAVRAFARELGAGTAVYGALLRAGADSVRVSLTVLDVATADRLAEVRRVDAVAHMDRLTDSLTVDVIRAVGRTLSARAPGAAPLRPPMGAR